MMVHAHSRMVTVGMALGSAGGGEKDETEHRKHDTNIHGWDPPSPCVYSMGDGAHKQGAGTPAEQDGRRLGNLSGRDTESRPLPRGARHS
jgi:hypothetical protein